MRTILPTLMLLVACAPPDPLETEEESPMIPEVRILYPDPSEPLPLDEDGFLRTLVVVDLIDVDFVAPGADAELVEGQAHWHLFVQETQYLAAPGTLWFDLESDAYTAGSRGILNVDLRANDHGPYLDLDEDCLCEDRIEFDVVGPEGV